MLGSAQDAEDALQETLLAAWQGLRGFEGRASMRSWLYRIATTRSLNMLRSASRRPPAPSSNAAGPPRGPPPPTLPPRGGGPPAPPRLGEGVGLEPYPDVLLQDV